MSRRSLRLLAFLALALVTTLAACGTAASRKVDANEAVGMLAARTVIDVRTPTEFAAGHIAGATNIDVEAADFGAKIAALDPKAAYLVYCHSGRRSAIAAKTMVDAGFRDIADGGALDALIAAGAPRG